MATYWAKFKLSHLVDTLANILAEAKANTLKNAFVVVTTETLIYKQAVTPLLTLQQMSKLRHFKSHMTVCRRKNF